MTLDGSLAFFLGIKPGKFRPPDKLIAMLAARGTVRNSVRWAMMKRRESSHGYRERTSGPAPGWT
ncbi:hypothetical protein GHK03_00675 [Sinorhizobium medicae]|nr:hypothetical protein [Sinorhizobium medicae]